MVDYLKNTRIATNEQFFLELIWYLPSDDENPLSLLGE